MLKANEANGASKLALVAGRRQAGARQALPVKASPSALLRTGFDAPIPVS